jgi:hypothetical protein
MIKKLSILLPILLISACASISQPTYHYNEVLIINNSKQLIQDVTITINETGRSFSCGNIAPLGICGNKIPRRRYTYSPIQIAWVFGSTARQTEEFVLKVPAMMHIGLPLRGVFDISPQGEMSAFFEQKTPLR